MTSSSKKERPGSPRARLFVALDLPDPIVAPLAQWTADAFGGHPDLRPVRPESLHVTLVFLGYMYERDVERIAATAFAQDLQPIELRPVEVQPVPRSRPRLFALQLEDPGGKLGAWQQGLSERLHAAGLYEPEKRPFWPHVTLARAKRGKNPRGIVVPELTEDLRRPFLADTVTLYRSTLRPQGAVYEALAEGKKTPVH
jgi:RNA 2',3'-cyclic 3'-phosphodiesterase